MKWFKFYGQDWNTDPKIASMSMEDRLCLVTLFTIASSEDKEGYIPSLTEEALIYIARIPDWPESDYNPRERVTGVMKRYEALHIVTFNPKGGVTVCNFKKRQGENLTNAERQKNYRIRHRIGKKQSNDSNAGVTTSVTLDKIREDKIREDSEDTSRDTVSLIDSFKEINTAYKKWYKNTTQRGACERLVAQHGLEQTLKVIAILPKTNNMPYMPKITTPLQLEDKWASLEAQLKSKKAETLSKKVNLIL